MNIGIDARLLSTPVRGVASYLANLIKYLPEHDKVNSYFVFQYEDIPQETKYYTYILIKKNRLPRQLFEHYWLNFSLPRLIKKHNIDVFFTPYIFVPLIKKDWKNVTVIPDALTKSCKKYYSFHYRKYMDIFVPPSLKRSDAIITISESAKNDITKYYRINSNIVHVNYLWADAKFGHINLTEDQKSAIRKKFNLPEKYVLFVSVLEERKNIEGIIRVSDLIQSKGNNIKFVLVGREGFGFDKISSELGKRQNQIVHLKIINNEELILIYNLAEIFFFPSHYEGFGLPPLEAMKCGIPVIASDNSSLPEVVGDGGTIGDANDYDFFVGYIIKLLSNKNYYIKMKQKALTQAEKFSAEKHIRELIKVFNSFNIEKNEFQNQRN